MSHRARIYLFGVLVGEMPFEPPAAREPHVNAEIVVAVTRDHAPVAERNPLFLHGRLARA